MKKKVVSKTLLTEILCNSFGRKEAWIWFSYAATCLPEPCLNVQGCASIHLCLLNSISLVYQNSPRSVIFFQWLRCLILIVNVLYCKINHDSFPFLFISLEECQNNTPVNSPMLLLSNTLLCFSFFDGYCCSRSLNYHNFGISQHYELQHLDPSFKTNKNCRVRFKNRDHLFCSGSRCLCQGRLWFLIT